MSGLVFSWALLAHAAPALAGTGPYFEFETLAHAEPVPIEDFGKGWEAPLRPGGDALLHARLETGVHLGPWSVAWLQRLDYELRGSDGAAALYHRASNHEPFASGERFDLDLRVWHLASQGLRLARRQALGGVGTEVGVSLLEGTAVMDGALSGVATAVGGSDYDYQASVDYRYSEDALFDRSVGRPYGRGYALDLGAHGEHFDRRLSWRLRVLDAFGRMHWESAPATAAVANSDNKEYDADGYVRYNPTLSGWEGFQPFRQRLHPRALAESLWRTGESWAWGSRVRITEVNAYVGALAQGTLGPWRAEVEVLPAERVLGLGVGWKGIAVRWQADRLDASDAHFLSALLQAQYAFD